jgi:hypothetical protein
MSGICVTNVCSIYKPGSFARRGYGSFGIRCARNPRQCTRQVSYTNPHRNSARSRIQRRPVRLDPADVNSWLFIEPQTDEVFFASDPRMTSVANIYAGSGIFTLSRLTGYSRGFSKLMKEVFFQPVRELLQIKFIDSPANDFLITFYETFL